jgi:dTMP kinase
LRCFYTGFVTSPNPSQADASHWPSNLAGAFIVFEGPDGSGKSTQFRRFLGWCHELGIRVTDVREPGGTLVGGDIRDILLDPAHEAISLRCEMLLYMASRAQLVEKIIRPALEAGRCVLADRYVPSTLAYQGAAGGLPVEEIHAVARVATMGLEPDAVLIFDVDETTAAKRLSPLLDRMEAKGVEFHRKVRRGYLEQARKHPDRYRVIDGSLPEATVWGLVQDALKSLLGTRRGAGAPLAIGASAVPRSSSSFA